MNQNTPLVSHAETNDSKRQVFKSRHRTIFIKKNNNNNYYCTLSSHAPNHKIAKMGWPTTIIGFFDVQVLYSYPSL